MKKLFIVVVLCSSVFVRAMQPKEKAVIGVLGAAWASYLIYEFLIKDPQVRLQEHQKREKRRADTNVRIGLIALEKK